VLLLVADGITLEDRRRLCHNRKGCMICIAATANQRLTLKRRQPQQLTSMERSTLTADGLAREAVAAQPNSLNLLQFCPFSEIFKDSVVPVRSNVASL
jgi:hypothetical protein